MSTNASTDPEVSRDETREREALKLEYEYLRSENIRLRDGRGSLTRQLGPLPISAAIVAGLVTGLTRDVHANAFLWSALGLFLVLALISIWYSGMKPYRVLRREKEACFTRSRKSPVEWYKSAIALEEAIYGEPSDDKGLRARLPRSDIKSLQEGYDRERSGLFIIQGLFALVIILLVVSRVA